MREKLDIIWNTSLVCPWDCDICCVDAVHVTSENGQISVKSNELQEQEYIPKINGESIWDTAAKFRQSQGLELNLEQKIQVLKNINSDYKVKINFSGGDPLVLKETFNLIKKAYDMFGKESIQISTTGAGLSKYNPLDLVPLINKLKFSYDSAEGLYNPNRPSGYNNSNLKHASQFSKEGIFTMAETPLTIRNTKPETIALIYENLHLAEIDQVLPMRLFPVGRGMNRQQETPTSSQYLRALDTFKKLEEKYKTPTLKPQCALKYLNPHGNKENPCDLYNESVAITPNGTLITSAWAIGPTGKPLDDAFVLGNISENHIDDILNSPKAKYYENHINDNFGHCKIFAYFNSKKEDPLERIFDKADHLYLT